MRKWIARVQAYVIQVELALIWAALTGFLVVAGPFGFMDALPLGTATLFWGTVVGGVILLVAMVRAAIVVALPALGTARRIIIVCAAMLIFVPPLVWALQVAILGTHPNALRLYLTVACIAAVIGTIRYVMSEGEPATRAPEAPELPRLAARLADPGATIHAISADDHYVIVQTSCGVERVLLRFSDALEELDGLPGLRVHRSHWVARDAVARFKRGSQKSTITLVNGADIPVSRGYRASVEADLPEEVA